MDLREFLDGLLPDPEERPEWDFDADAEDDGVDDSRALPDNTDH